VRRHTKRTKIQFDLPGAKLPPSLASQTFKVNQYGIEQINFVQSSANAVQMIMTVDSKSPNWVGYYSRLGGITLLPSGGIRDLQGQNPNPSAPVPITPTNPSPENNEVTATIESLDLNSNGTQLLIRSDRPIQGTGGWNRRLNAYEVRLNNAQLSEQFRGPQLNSRSPVYRIRVRQEDNQTVVLILQPRVGFRFGQLTRLNNQVLGLDISSQQASNPSRQTIQVPPPVSNPFPQPANPTPPSVSVPKGRHLVVIDPGHGGKDPGAVGIGGLQEKNVILPISQMVADYLKARGVRVTMTRSSDYFVSLRGALPWPIVSGQIYL
jgi:N-acetylmuramoyl-L-alanine amidase